jgi:hypothetical protein
MLNVMKDIEIFYLVAFSLDSVRREVVAKVRISGQPEESCIINTISLQEFRRIWIRVFKLKPEIAEKQVRRMQEGLNIVLNLHASESKLQMSGLLGKRPA